MATPRPCSLRRDLAMMRYCVHELASVTRETWPGRQPGDATSAPGVRMAEACICSLRRALRHPSVRGLK